MYIDGSWPKALHPDKCGVMYMAYADGQAYGYKLSPGQLSQSAEMAYHKINQAMPCSIVEYRSIT
jgi:hypothetical protein